MNSVGKIRKMFFLFILFFITNFTISSAFPGRWEKEISGEGWRLWLDHAAEWYNDDIYLPPVNISSLPVNPPTCGWDNLDAVYDKNVTVPGTVEEYFWGEIGGTIPDVGGDYVGVSWWSTTFTLDPNIHGKRIIIYFESVISGQKYLSTENW